MEDKEMVKEFKSNVSGVIEPKFRDPGQLSPEQLTDPDYALKQLEKLNGGRLSITCSKCHHCRQENDLSEGEKKWQKEQRPIPIIK